MKDRVALDLSVTVSNQAGSQVYASRLVEALRPLIRARLVELVSPLARPARARKGVADRARTLGQDLWWSQFAVERRARRAGAALLHVPAGIGPVSGTLPVVATMFDMTVIRFPERFPRWFRSYAGRVMPRLAHRAEAIITLSEASKADIVELLGVRPEKVTVIHVAIPPHAEVDAARVEELRHRLALPPRFVLTVGSLEPRKNLPRLLAAIARLREGPETAEVQLVHAGPAGWLAGEVGEAIVRLGLRDRVRFLGYLPEEDLAALYSAATLTAYPSLYEGFGLPVAEAMARGCPVVTSNLSSMPEVAGDAAILVDPADEEDIARGIAALWTDEGLRAAHALRGIARAATFTAERMGRETVAVYDRVLGG